MIGIGRDLKKNIAVVGCGHWGRNLVRNFAEIGVLYSVCDPNFALSGKFSDKFKVKNLSFEQSICDPNIEGVVLAVPASLHASMAMDAMRCGKNVYVEKPLALNQDEAQEMILCAEQNNVKIMVGHLLQYHPAYVNVLRLVKGGGIGELRYLYSNRLSFGKVRSEEDVIWSFAPHDISMILSLVGEQPLTVNVVGAEILQPNIFDTATIHMEFASGLKSHVSVSWLHPYKEQTLVVIGDSGMVVFDDTREWHEKLAIYRHKISPYSDSATELHQSEVEYISLPVSEPLRNECQHFVDVINDNLTPLTDAEEGLRVLKVLSAATLSRSQNSQVTGSCL